MTDTSKVFFSNADNKEVIREAIEFISRLPKPNAFETQRNRHTLKILEGMKDRPNEWDASCAINIGWIGNSFISALQNLPTNSEKLKIDSIYAMGYRFLLELYLSIRNDLVIEFEQARTFALENLQYFEATARDQIEYAWREMPISILKSLMTGDQIQTLKDFSHTVDFAKQQRETWNTEIKERENRVNQLKNNLDQYESGFNFVGLHQGFEEMSVAKNKEKNNIKFWLNIFGALIILPFAIEATVIWTNLKEIEALKTALIISVVPTISLAGVLIFYFRVLLHNYNATKSQILQIELRKTLCRFIQSYVVYAEKMTEKNQGSLARFEGIIFSGLVSSDDKLPSTFDGLEQIGNILKSMKK